MFVDSTYSWHESNGVKKLHSCLSMGWNKIIINESFFCKFFILCHFMSCIARIANSKGRASAYLHLRQSKTVYLKPNITLQTKPKRYPNHNPIHCLSLTLNVGVSVKSSHNPHPIP